MIVMADENAALTSHEKKEHFNYIKNKTFILNTNSIIVLIFLTPNVWIVL